MIGHDAGLATIWQGTAIGALLYHPPRPCANPAAGIKMNKPTAIAVNTKSRLQNHG
jgi:hypothetical protein